MYGEKVILLILDINILIVKYENMKENRSPRTYSLISTTSLVLNNCSV